MVQEVSVTGAVIVTTPQQVALADALKGINMFRGDKINVPVLGIIENMSSVQKKDAAELFKKSNSKAGAHFGAQFVRK